MPIKRRSTAGRTPRPFMRTHTVSEYSETEIETDVVTTSHLGWFAAATLAWLLVLSLLTDPIFGLMLTGSFLTGGSALWVIITWNEND